MDKKPDQSGSDRRAVCLNCIDGRAQIPAIHWIMENHGIDYVDMITEPGMNGLLADPDRPIDEIQRKIRLSIDVNKASVLVVVGHYDCRGNPVDESEHKRQLSSAVARLRKECPIPVVALWITADWTGEQVTL